MKNTILTFSILLLGISLFIRCSNTNSTPVEIGNNTASETELSEAITVTQKQFDMAKMELGTMANQNFPSTIRATGKIEIPSKSQIRVSAYAGGYVTRINLMPGEKINKGQVLFTLENPEFVQMQQDYLEAKEQLTYLKSDFERQKTLADENIASQKNFLKAESIYRVTLAKMEGMKKRLSLINIRTDQINSQNLVSAIAVYAPANGYVTEVLATKGMYLNPTDVAVEMMNTNNLYLELQVFEKDVLKIKKGQKINFTIPDASMETYEATVHLIGKMVDESTRMVRVHADLKNSKANLIAGMYVDAQVVTEDHPAKGLPETAIVTEEETDYLLIQLPKKEGEYQFEKRAVTVGQRQNGFAQILNGEDFSGKEQILVNGGFNLIGIE